MSQSDDIPDWVLAQTLERRRRELETDEREYAGRLAAARQKEVTMRKLSRAHRVIMHEEQGDDLEEADFLPDDHDTSEDRSNDELSNVSPAVRALMNKLNRGTGGTEQEQEPMCTKIYYASRTHSQLAQILHELRKLRIQLNLSLSSHSEYPLALPGVSDPARAKRSVSDIDDDDDPQTAGTARTVSLGSRKQLCIHEELRRRTGDLDEACRQMLGEKGKQRCPHLPGVDDEVRMLDLRDQILVSVSPAVLQVSDRSIAVKATPKDIEDLVVAGQNMETCPYFGSRRAIPQAQLVLLPYNLLLQKTAREAIGIDLKDQVIIIDEAHNLTSSLLSLSTTRLPFRTLSTARQQLSIYLSRFRTRLATAHAVHLTRLMMLLDALHKNAEEWRESLQQANTPGKQDEDQKALPAKHDRGKARGPGVEVMTPGELLQRLGRKTEGVNLLEIEVYLRNSKIARKISGYTVKTLEKAAGKDSAKLAKVARLSGSTPPLHAVESFITALTSANDDGRVSFSLENDQLEIKYQHLNPSTHFQDVIDVARSIILAGGTMSPANNPSRLMKIPDIINQLFSKLPNERIATFSCGHIIPPSNLQTLVLKKGPRGSELTFKYEQRSDRAMILELGQILLNFSNLVPGGMVVFLPSYSFLNVVKTAWEGSGLMNKLKAKKKVVSLDSRKIEPICNDNCPMRQVFLEPQDSSQVETVLRDYAAAIHDGAGVSRDEKGPTKSKTTGALLFAVIGAKLSEGLNFTDDLARAVVIIGLPFANLASPELRERMEYVNRMQKQVSEKLGSAWKMTSGTKDAATELYENMCMNAVNQSIGRAIRHRGDWASLILVDSRYTLPRIREKLPKWIGQGTLVTDGFGQAIKEMARFYREKRG
ncbi:uncharacterized protein FIBRA_05094 [Fibroporia radiculosa]|uniref:ATP-dependent DNA helicase CHL1 n=1 Tax=Fibroporia radiculosa TaxID=599839 RepID=J4H3B4_9APHY|nr:uncharacterized protein FIBRA_05094 [Fibroporia radiculosa]CCM02979.1 predicted protein [Fibroporia radiculosa]